MTISKGLNIDDDCTCNYIIDKPCPYHEQEVMTSQQDTELLTRKCCTCKVVKPITDFYLRKTTGRRLYDCKPCRKSLVQQDYIKKRGERLARMKRYRESEAGKQTAARTSRNATTREPEKNLARYKLRYAVGRGKVIKQPCQDCGEQKVEAHHHNGYDEPHWYDVMWLCRKHHRDIHKFSLESRGLV